MVDALVSGKRSRLRRICSCVLSSLAILIITAVLLEGALRVVGLKPRSLPYNNNLGDAVLGMAPERNQVWKANFPEYGGTLIMRTNNLGFYEDTDTRPLPDPGVTRIVVLGDSFVVGTCTPPENFPNQIEKRLNASAKEYRYEVIDAGVGRYSPYQYYVKAKTEAVPLKPREILVAIYVGNDFLDIIREDDRPYLTRSPDGAIESHPPLFIVYRNPNEQPSWLEHSRLYSVGHAAVGPTLLYQVSRVRLLYRNLADAHRGLIEIAGYLKEVRGLDAISHGLMVQSLHQYVWFQRFPETLQTSLEFTRFTLEKFRELGEQNAIHIVLTVIPTKPMMEPETLREVFARVNQYDRSLTVEKLIAFENSLVDQTLKMSRRLGLETIDLRPGIAAAKQGRPLFYPDDMHLNVEGNAVVADALTNAGVASRLQ
jgi:hypothetical protein